MKLYDRNGQPIADILEWARLFSDPDYQCIGRTEISLGRTVSTSWIGIDRSHGLERTPLIFETLVFFNGNEAERWLYATEEEARKGHNKIVHDLCNGVLLA